ncbi:MAG: RsgA2 [Cyanobacteria bacterium RYN_339]|nr:RsgA2 [Cyanobacteria bacterium RYN_339]
MGASTLTKLTDLGWNARLESSFEIHARAGRVAGRVITEHPDLYRVLTPAGERLAAPGGKLRHQAVGRGDLPAVGDWVALDLPPDGRAAVAAVLPRASKFSRLAAGGGGEQIVAANVDTVLLVAAANRDFNVRRLERYVGLGWASGAQPVVVISKADLAEDLAALVAAAEAVAPGVPVLALGALQGVGLDQLAPYLLAGKTLALLGSSGAGKSTLLNALAGEVRLATSAARAGDDRGRHTTTHRELVVLPNGSMVIDTPGMRELGVWDADAGLGRAFEDIEALVARCRYADCRHSSEPGCAVRAGLDAGDVSQERLDSYVKLRREQAYQARKEDNRLAHAEKQKWKQVTKQMRGYSKG